MALSDEDKQWILEQLARTDAKLERTETRLEEKLEQVETNLLTAFHKWASPMETRVRSHTQAIHALDAELEALKDRVEQLEKRR